MAWIKTADYSGYSIHSSDSAHGAGTTSVVSEALEGFSGNSVIVGTLKSSVSLTAAENKIALQISLDGTNWATIKTGTQAANPLTNEVAFTIDATGINAPYYRFQLTVTSAASPTVTWKWAQKKGKQ